MPRLLVPCVLCAILLSRSNCLLARIMFDVRPVAVREWNDEAATQKPDTGQFKVNYARIKLNAPIDENLIFKFAYAFHSVNAIDRVTGISNAVSEASVTGKVSEMASVIIGKQWGYQGGWEGDYSPFAVYRYSPSSSFMSYVITGVSLKAKLAENVLNLMLFNPDSSTTGASKYEGEARQKKLAAGINFMGGAQDIFRPLVQYHLAPRSDKAANNTNYVLGLQINLESVKIEYDSMHSILESYTIDGKNDENHGNVIKLEYRNGPFRPSIKSFDNNKIVAGQKIERSVGGTLAMEYLAAEKIGYWYFLAYTRILASARVASGMDRDVSELMAGIVAYDVPLQ